MGRVRKNPPRKAKAAGSKAISRILGNNKVFRTGKGGGRGGRPGGNPPGPSGPRRKTDDELREDAKAIHETFRKGKTQEAADKSYNRKTVATAQDADGNLYYSVSSRGTSPESRALAERLGYKRVDGPGFVKTDPKQTHAEHILANATEQGHLKPPIRMSPSRKPCDSYNNPSNQGCGDRAANNPQTDLVGWP
ncbi:hypothetical protein [Glycomyces paridis]|uniref:Uncharacterized protein n=1 Tax=Glycomyces paridis TaxID=2126555 RepID=A0A4S8PIR6_9ACTN|nr:hypothetical protein [Glycomyces paridis]THV29555.1 hypothetical protein E9998_08635 [Glycomyces paridis]